MVVYGVCNTVFDTLWGFYEGTTYKAYLYNYGASSLRAQVAGNTYYGTSWNAGTWEKFVLVGDAAGVHFYRSNGSFITTTAHSAGTTYTVNRFFSGDPGDSGASGFSYAYLADRPWSLEEIRSFNVYSLVPNTRRFFPVSTQAGPSTYTLTAATYVPGSLTATGVTPRITRVKS
jgi:hypothetical protein